MFELQRHLEERYSSLRDTRKGKVFFVEHGLTNVEVSELSETLRATLAIHSLEEPYWDNHPIPLLVAATEIGYRYRGHGTDFWPLLEEELSINLGATVRQRVRDLFVSATERYRGVRPSDSPWARAFHLIAWPITHSLVPVEFHRPLAATLANLYANIRELDDADLYNAVRSANRHSSVRFDTWLLNPELVVMVTRMILGTDKSDFAEETVERIIKDISHDDNARRDVVIARRLQRTVRKNRSTEPGKQGLFVVNGRLQLRKCDGRITLEMFFPQLDHALFEPTRQVLRRRRYAPRLWGASMRVPSEKLLSGLPFSLKLESQPEEGAELLPGVSDLEIDDDQRELLRSLRLDFNPPILFAVNTDGEVAVNIRGNEISGYKRYWLLTSPANTSMLKTLPNLGDVGPYTCIELDPSEPAAMVVLQKLNYQVRHGISVGFAGAPPLNRDSLKPKFAVGDVRLVVPRGPLPDGTMVKLGEKEVPLIDDLVKVDVLEGEHVIIVSTNNQSRNYGFQGAKHDLRGLPLVCWIELVAPELSVQSLLAGKVSLRVESFLPLEGLELTVEIEAAGRRFGVSVPLGPLPEIIEGNAELWSSLLDESSRQLVLQDLHPKLHARVGSLAFGSWPLERRVRACWWENCSTEISLRSELGALEFGGVKVSRPFNKPDPRITDNDTEAVLFVPLGLDPSMYDPSATFTTLCVAPSRMSLHIPSVQKPRLRRRRRADGDSIGLEDLMEAYLRWALAESASLTAEIRRRQMIALLDNWVSELCCGEIWFHQEAKFKASTSDPWQLLVKTFGATELGMDTYVELTPGDKAIVNRLAVAEIRRIRPELWTLVGTSCDLDDDDYGALDLACGRAYEQLAEEYVQRGQEDLAEDIAEGDPGTDGDEWDTALQGIKALAEFHPLAELLIPSDKAAKLVALDFSLMSLDDLTEEFIRWSHGAQRALVGNLPEERVLETILMLWLAPERAVKLDWRGGALNTLIAERCVARVGRYMFLRSIAQNHGGYV